MKIDLQVQGAVPGAGPAPALSPVGPAGGRTGKKSAAELHGKKHHQEIHLWPAGLAPDRQPAHGPMANAPAPIPLAFVPMVLAPGQEPTIWAEARDRGHQDGTLVEPFFNQQEQLRLFVMFPMDGQSMVNGEQPPRLAVLSPGDVFHLSAGVGFQVSVFNRPQLGPPPASALGKPCPVCRVPFLPEATCFVCACGVLLHCEPDEKQGLQCAQLRRECPVCKKPILLTESYLDTPGHED